MGTFTKEEDEQTWTILRWRPASILHWRSGWCGVVRQISGPAEHHLNSAAAVHPLMTAALMAASSTLRVKRSDYLKLFPEQEVRCTQTPLLSADCVCVGARYFSNVLFYSVASSTARVQNHLRLLV